MWRVSLRPVCSLRHFLYSAARQPARSPPSVLAVDRFSFSTCARTGSASPTSTAAAANVAPRKITLPADSPIQVITETEDEFRQAVLAARRQIITDELSRTRGADSTAGVQEDGQIAGAHGIASTSTQISSSLYSSSSSSSSSSSASSSLSSTTVSGSPSASTPPSQTPARPRLVSLRHEERLRQAEERIQQSILTDTYGRFHSYLRISLTERCNLRCQVSVL